MVLRHFVVVAFAIAQAYAGNKSLTADVGVYGATPAGLIAAIAAAREGRRVIVLEATDWIGGMMTGGLSHADIGDPRVTGGLAMDIFRRIARLYEPGANATDDIACFAFEPQVASRAFAALLADPAFGAGRVSIRVNQTLRSVARIGGALTGVTTDAGLTLAASVWIDASYEGDLAAAAGAPMVFGRESTDEFGEGHAGVRPPCPSDRYAFQAPLPDHFAPGSDNRTLLPLINTDAPRPAVGSADLRPANMCYRLCMTANKSDSIPVAKPEAYDPDRWELQRRYYAAWGHDTLDKALTIHTLPRNTTDWNVGDAVSLDVVGGSWPSGGGRMPPFWYANATWPQRRAIIRFHREYTRGFLYFLQNDPGVPAAMREAARRYGFCRRAWPPRYGGFPPQLYVREGRRLRGAYVLVEADRRWNTTKHDTVALGSYSLDCHPSVRYATTGSPWVHNEGMLCGLRRRRRRLGPRAEFDMGPFEIPYRSLLPRRGEAASNLLVPTALSASHVAFCAVRMEPTWMALGHAAGIAAHMTLAAGGGAAAVHDVDVAVLQATLRAQGSVVSKADIAGSPRDICPPT